MNNKRILIVDDEEDICESVATFIADLGETVLAFNGVEALKKIESEPFDLIITDFDMPHGNGLNLLKIIAERHISLPVILMTGRGSDELCRESWTHGLLEYVEKPFRHETLYTVVKDCLAAGDNGPVEMMQQRRISQVLLRPLQLIVDKSLCNEIEKVCAREGKSVSQFTQELFLRYLTEQNARKKSV